MEYLGYTARIVFDEEAGILFGEVEGLRDVVTFEATDIASLESAFRESVDDYLELCAKRKEEPERPYSGKFLVRLDARTHRDIAMAAARSGKSLNSFAGDVFREWIAQERSLQAAPYPSMGFGNAASDRTRIVPPNAKSRVSEAPRFLEERLEAVGDSLAIANPFDSSGQSKHTPASITPPRNSRTPSDSRTPSIEPQHEKVA